MNFKLFTPALLLLFAITVSVTSAQTPAPSPAATASIDEKSQQIVNRAIEVMGGPTYTSVESVLGKGFYSAFSDGASQVPARFLDYIVYPDRERTEFISMGIRTIQTNVGNTGWMFDGAIKKISDQNEAQVESFKLSMRTGLENLLRGWWRKDNATIKYVGRREAGLAKRNETIRLTYPNGFWIEYEFGAKDGFPAKIIYKRMRKNPDTGDEVETTEEDQLLKFISMNGITSPWVIDHFVNGKQATRINYESILYNQKFPDSLFAKPENLKAIK
jgi:hypothetical protein